MAWCCGAGWGNIGVMSTPTRSPGRFIVIDGVDGCGKSTQATRLVRRLESEWGLTVQHLREPGSTRLGEALRSLLLSREQSMGAEVESLLFCAARRQMLDELVAPALARGEWVVCERFHSSTLAYQAGAGGADRTQLLDLLLGWAGRPAPDRVVILELDVGQASGRRGEAQDRIEDKGLEFQARVAEAMAAYVAETPQARSIPGDGTVSEVGSRVWASLEELTCSVEGQGRQASGDNRGGAVQQESSP